MSSRTATRGDHLKNLVRIFRRRGCDWGEFGDFLCYLFETSPFRLSALGCRHSPSHGDLAHTAEGTLPCRTCGSKDSGKAMKFVSYDLRVLARQWCMDQGHVYLSIADRHQRSAPVFSITREDNTLDDSVIDSSVAGDEDTWAESLGLGLAAWGSSSPLRSSQEDATRTSTGVRVHVLAYLYRFWDSPVQLEMAYHRLRDSSDSILHLCGCGICRHGDKGCTEPSHLYLGTQQENLSHAHWHAVLENLTQDIAEYQTVLEIIRRRCPNSAGIF